MSDFDISDDEREKRGGSGSAPKVIGIDEERLQRMLGEHTLTIFKGSCFEHTKEILFVRESRLHCITLTQRIHYLFKVLDISWICRFPLTDIRWRR